MQLGKFGGTLSPLSTLVLGVSEILPCIVCGRGIVAICSSGDQGEPCW